MNMKPRMLEALNKQINAELYSSYLYLSMAAYCQTLGLRGFAHWLRSQESEERGHAMKFFGYIQDRGGTVSLRAIAQPEAAWKSPLKVFEAVCEHEAKVTAMIHELVDVAATLHDHATGVMLQWFVSEQVEEEATAAEILQKLEQIGDSTAGLMVLDQQLMQRGK